MKRFVTYIYEYERGIRGRNVGFIRTDIRDDHSRMEIHIRGLDRFKGRCPVYLIVNDEPPVGILSAELVLTQGTGHMQFTYPMNRIGDSGYPISSILALSIRCGNGKMLVGSFTDSLADHVLRGDFRIWEKPAETGSTDSVDVSDISEPEPVDPPVSPDEPKAEDEPAVENLSIESAPENKINYEKIEITDIRSLPKQNWHLCNNSFLVHGFFNYHYLILKTVDTKDGVKRFLGVPGIYEQPERMMALLFGFPEFEAAQKDEAKDAAGSFGYWMCLLAES